MQVYGNIRPKATVIFPVRFQRPPRLLPFVGLGGCMSLRMPQVDRARTGNRMSIIGLVSGVIVGGVGGWLAGRLVTGYGFGLIGNIVVGIAGAILAQVLFPRIGLGFGGGLFSAIVRSTLGAVLLLLLIRLLKRK